MLNYYKQLLQSSNDSFLNEYLNDSLLLRLKDIGYFCGMDYASKDIYDFNGYISRYDHSLNVALLIYKLTQNKKMAIAGLYHDISTPCFSHVIDYMNKDYLKQESTEEYTKHILENDYYLQKILNKNNIVLKDIIDFKKYSIVDNERPQVCADRVDGVILNSIGWTKLITEEDIFNIVNDITIYQNEYGQNEIGFQHVDIAERFTYLNDEINIKMHSKEDNYMMELLANITQIAIRNGYISYEELFSANEKEIFNRLDNLDDNIIKNLLTIFKNIKKDDISDNYHIDVKNRNINPLVKGRRLN